MTRVSATDATPLLPKYWINGAERNEVNARDRGIRFGDGLFETVRVVRGKPEFWDLHLDRLVEGCERLGIAGDRAYVDAAVAESLAAVEADIPPEAVLRVTLTRGEGGAGYRPGASEVTLIIAIEPMRPTPPAALRVAHCATKATGNPSLAGLKHLNRLDNVLAAAELESGAWDEGVMYSMDGLVVSGVMSNLFLVLGGVVHTPELSVSGVAGTMRRWILESAAPTLGLECRETALDRSVLAQAQEVFFSSSLMGIRPVRILGDLSWDEWPVCKRLQRALAATRGEPVDA